MDTGAGSSAAREADQSHPIRRENKITSFRATASGVVANGTLTGKLSAGTSTSRQSAPVKFAVAAASKGARCNVITLRLAPLDLELLGVQVTTSQISLDVYVESLPASAAQAQPQTCQVLKLVLGPLHLDLLGLVVDLYGKTTANPVIVTINAIPSQGLLGQLLCGLAGGGITSLGGLQSLLSSLGVNLSTTQIQNILNQLGITDLSSGLTQLDLSHT